MRIYDKGLPEHVELAGWDESGCPVLVCSAPLHERPRDYVGRRGARGRECPACMGRRLEAAEREAKGDAA